MKQTLSMLLLVLSFFGCAQLFAQKTIEYDFQARKSLDLGKVDGIQEGDNYQIVIRHINLNLYKVTLQTRDSMIIPPQKTPDFSLLSTSTLTGILAGVPSLGGIQLRSIDAPTLSGGITADAEFGVRAVRHRMTKADTRVLDKYHAEKKKVDDRNQIAVRMNSENGIINSNKTILDRQKQAIDAMLTSATYYQLKAKCEFDNGALYDAFNTLGANFDVVAAAGTIATAKSSVSTVRAAIKAAGSSYNDYSNIEANKTIIAKDEVLKKSDADIKDAYTKLLAAADAIDSLVNPAKVNDLFSNIINQKNAEGYTYTSMPVQFKNDQAQVSLTITPIVATSSLQSYTIPFVFPVFKKQYIGIGISFYGSNLHNDAYSVLAFKKDTTVVDSVVKEKPGNGEFGMCALLQYGRKFPGCNNVGYHFNFGPGVSLTNTVRARLLFGGGLTFGRKHMLALNGGGIVGYVDRLSAALSTDMSYQILPSTVTVSKIEMGWFASIGYLYKF